MAVYESAHRENVSHPAKSRKIDFRPARCVSDADDVPSGYVLQFGCVWTYTVITIFCSSEPRHHQWRPALEPSQWSKMGLHLIASNQSPSRVLFDVFYVTQENCLPAILLDFCVALFFGIFFNRYLPKRGYYFYFLPISPDFLFPGILLSAPLKFGSQTRPAQVRNFHFEEVSMRC